jgi:glycosyltransferase involved in cell wall biosynthesis
VRVLVVTTSFPRSAEDASGHFVRAAALRIAAKGDDVHVVAPGGSPWDPPRSSGGITVHDAGGGSVFTWPGALARLREAPWRLPGVAAFAIGARARIRAIGQVDHAVAHWIVPSAFPLAASVRAPLEVVAHGADVRLLVASPRPLRERVIAGLLARGARFQFAASSLLKTLAQSLAPELAGRLAARSHVDPPALDVPDVSARAVALRASLALDADEALAVVACRLVPGKRVDLAIDGLRTLERRAQETPRRVRLVVVGDGPEREVLGKRAAPPDRVAFVGALPRREALAWIAAADVLVHASAIEAAPSVVREARALGVPVVACDAGDVAAWAHDDAGIRVAEATAEGLASAIRAALD